jgi:hypothetical protein
MDGKRNDETDGFGNGEEAEVRVLIERVVEIRSERDGRLLGGRSRGRLLGDTAVVPRLR